MVEKRLLLQTQSRYETHKAISYKTKIHGKNTHFKAKNLHAA
jgi:hypothetical protein